MILERDWIALIGTVPSQRAADALTSFARAVSASPDPAIDDQLAIDSSGSSAPAVRLVEIPSIRFADGSAEILPRQQQRLDQIALVLNATPNVSVTVVGHTDQRGDAESNILLSQMRAQAVVAYLAGHGVAGGRLSTLGRGEADLLSASDDATSMELNRRIEFVVFGLFEQPATDGTVAP